MKCKTDTLDQVKSAKKGLNMKRSAYRGRKRQVAFSKGFLRAVSISDICQGVICVFCTVKINI